MRIIIMRLELLVKLLIVLVALPSCSTMSSRVSNERVLFFADSILTVRNDSIVETFKASDGDYIIGSFEVPRESPVSTKYKLFLAGLIIIGLIATGVIINRKLHKNLNAINQKNEAISQALNKLLHDNIYTIKRLNEEREYLNQKDADDFYPDRLEALQNKIDTMSRSIDRLHNKVPLLKNLEESLNSTKDGIMITARELFGEALNENDYGILIGILSGLNANEISFLTGLTPGTVRTRKSRLKDKIEKFPNSQETELFLNYF